MGEYETAILDECFISALHGIDKSCSDLLYSIKDCYSDNCAIIHKEYYDPSSPCHATHHKCNSDSDPNFITQEEAKEYLEQNAKLLRKAWPNIKKYLKSRKGVHPDVMMLAIADKYKNAIVLSCDGRLLRACHLKKVAHLCLKAALVGYDRSRGIGSFFGDTRYNVQDMLNDKSNHWYLDFGKKDRCKDCKSNCDFKTCSQDYVKKYAK